MKFGAARVFAQGLVDMHPAKENGLDHAEPRTPETRLRQAFASGAKKFCSSRSSLGFPRRSSGFPWVDYEWLSPEQQEPAELFGCSYCCAGSTK
jgi:hypothetical protein